MVEKLTCLLRLYGLLFVGQIVLASDVLDLGYPEGTPFILNIGTHSDPPEPYDNVFVVGVEPLPEIASNIRQTQNRYIINAAIGRANGVSVLYHFKSSSSLLKPLSKPSRWHQKGRRGEKILVPLLSSADLIESLKRYACLFLKTDMQGMDFEAIEEMGLALQRCHWVMAETYCNNFTNYAGAQNDFERNWKPLMHDLGFKTSHSCGSKRGETNILWENKNLQTLEVPKSKCPRCFS